MAVISVIVIILGITVVSDNADHSIEASAQRYTSFGYSIPGAAFGADFYTYVYDGIDTIVDALDDLTGSAETIVSMQGSILEASKANIAATDALSNTVSKVGGMTIIAIGLAILAMSLKAIGSAFVLKSESATADNAPDVVQDTYVSPAEPQDGIPSAEPQETPEQESAQENADL